MCGFYTDTNSHVLNGCRQLKGLYFERHDRCVGLIKTELEKNITTEYCQLFHDQHVDLDGFNGTEIRCNKPHVCIMDNANGRAFIVEIANPFYHFIDMCYQQTFEKYMPLCLALISAGVHTKIILLIIVSLGVVHRKFISGLYARIRTYAR